MAKAKKMKTRKRHWIKRLKGGMELDIRIIRRTASSGRGVNEDTVSCDTCGCTVSCDTCGCSVDDWC